MIKKMKCVIVLSCLIVVVYSGVSSEYRNQLKSRMLDVAAICVPESNANEDDIAEIMDKKTPTRMEGKCLISCFQKKFGLQSEDGEPNKNGLLELLEPVHDEDPELYTKLIQIALTCGPRISEMGLKDHCEIAAQISACAMAEGKAIGVQDPFGLQD